MVDGAVQLFVLGNRLLQCIEERQGKRWRHHDADDRQLRRCRGCGSPVRVVLRELEDELELVVPDLKLIGVTGFKGSAWSIGRVGHAVAIADRVPRSDVAQGAESGAILESATASSSGCHRACDTRGEIVGDFAGALVTVHVTEVTRAVRRRRSMFDGAAGERPTRGLRKNVD